MPAKYVSRVSANRKIMDALFAHVQRQSTSRWNKSRAAVLVKLIEQFISAQAINLQYLKEDQQEANLIAIIQRGMASDLHKPATQQALNQALLDWKDTLFYSVYGTLPDNKAYLNQARGIANAWAVNGCIALNQWGEDLDIRQCLKDEIIDIKKVKPQQLTLPNHAAHILTPVSISDSYQSLMTHLQDALKVVTDNHIQSKVSLTIPVNCSNSHWCLATIVIENQKLTSATLWDSLAQQKDTQRIKSSSSYHNFQAAVNQVAKNVKVPVQLELVGIQKNNFSCMDFVVQKAYQQKKIDNQITAVGANATQLRQAIVSQIIGVDATASLVLDEKNKRLVDAKRFAQPSAKDETYAQLFKDLGVSQVTFDELFAAKLQAYYDSHPGASDERVLVESARMEACRFFKNKPVESSDVDRGEPSEVKRSNFKS